jgi:sterol desaturase/sphingolipid hydroxylase (fatty acid hydroxylase superfamily)
MTALLIYGLFLGIERLRPTEPHQPLHHILFNLQWYVFYTCWALLLKATDVEDGIRVVTTWLYGPYIKVREPNSVLETLAGVVIYFLLVDFFYYWFHCLQHRNGLMWALHKFHHSDVSLNVTSTQRVHWLEEPFIMVFVILPMGLLFRIEPQQLGMLAFIELLWLQFIHMNFRVGFGIFAPILGSPQHHRIHHSTRAEHLDKNFALFFPLWDIVFGTYYRPRNDEFPATGLTTGETYTELWSAITWSFRAVMTAGKKTDWS